MCVEVSAICVCDLCICAYIIMCVRVCMYWCVCVRGGLTRSCKCEEISFVQPRHGTKEMHIRVRCHTRCTN